MRKIGMVGLCLVAVFAITGIAAASAMAGGPEFMTCGKAAKVGKKYTGGYNNKTCTEANATHEGKYATSPVSLPSKFEGKSKATTFYYSSGGHIVWKVTCKKDKEVGTIEEPTEFEDTVTFESCEAANEETKAKKVKCSTSPIMETESRVVLTLPAEHAGAVAAVTVLPYDCGSTKFDVGEGAAGGEVDSTSKGESWTWAVNKATGEPTIREFLLEENAVGPFEQTGETTETSGTRTFEVGLEGGESLGSKGVVIIK